VLCEKAVERCLASEAAFQSLRLDVPTSSWDQRVVSQITKAPDAEVVVDIETVRALLSILICRVYLSKKLPLAGITLYSD
jgi:hypothetical protein